MHTYMLCRIIVDFKLLQMELLQNNKLLKEYEEKIKTLQEEKVCIILKYCCKILIDVLIHTNSSKI